MKKRRIFWATMLLLGLTFAGLSWYLLHRGKVASIASLNKVKLGMTRTEVEAALGEPSSELPHSGGLHGPYRPPSLYYYDSSFWCGDRDSIVVQFDETGRVSQKDIFKAGPDTRSLREKFWDQLKYMQYRLRCSLPGKPHPIRRVLLIPDPWIGAWRVC
jgi:hypothetical protein